MVALASTVAWVGLAILAQVRDREDANPMPAHETTTGRSGGAGVAYTAVDAMDEEGEGGDVELVDSPES